MVNKKKATTHYLYINFKQYKEGGEICKGQETDAFPSKEPTYYSYTYLYAQRADPTGKDLWRNGLHRLEVTPEVLAANTVFLAIVVYQDGDTFGTSHGNHEIIGGYTTRKEAEEVLSLVNKEGIDLAGYDGYTSWTGYFSGLEDKIVQKLDIED